MERGSIGNPPYNPQEPGWNQNIGNPTQELGWNIGNPADINPPELGWNKKIFVPNQTSTLRQDSSRNGQYSQPSSPDDPNSRRVSSPADHGRKGEYQNVGYEHAQRGGDNPYAAASSEKSRHMSTSDYAKPVNKQSNQDSGSYFNFTFKSHLQDLHTEILNQSHTHNESH